MIYFEQSMRNSGQAMAVSVGPLPMALRPQFNECFAEESWRQDHQSKNSCIYNKVYG